MYNTQILPNSTESEFIPRNIEQSKLVSLIKNKIHSVIYSPHNSGKDTFITNSLYSLNNERYNYQLYTLDLLSTRSEKDFIKMYYEIVGTNEVMSLFEMEGSHENISLSDILYMTHESSEKKEHQIIIYIKEFQNVLKFDNSNIIEIMDKVLGTKSNITYILSGSQINSMKYIFENKKYFYHSTESVILNPINILLVENYLSKSYLKMGKVIPKNVTEHIYELLNGNLWYMIQLSNICINKTLGYLNLKVVEEGLESLLHMYEIRFYEIVNNLSNYQIIFLKAMIEGVTKFSSLSIIEKYSLNSSANVLRVKDALMKKEIITYDKKNNIAEIIDPLFAIWLKEYFFKIK